MNSAFLFEAMTDIENEYIVSAQKRLGYDNSNNPKNKAAITNRTVRTTAALISAVILMMALCFTTAMAASEEFREMVFSFFHIEQQEVIPEYDKDEEISADDMFVEPGQNIIGGVIECRYVHLPVASHARNGVYLVCTDDVEMKQGSHYDVYCEENGEFIRLEEKHFCEDYTLYGSDIHVEFDWAEYNGIAHITWVEPNLRFRYPNNAGSASSALFTFELDNGSQYPVLINLHTGEMTDVLAGTGAEQLQQIANSAISEDKTKMLLVQNDGALYYADLNAKKLYSVDELSGEHADSCSLIGNTLACWSLTDDIYKAWNIDLTTFKRRELFAGISDAASTEAADAGIIFIMGFDTWIHWGNMYAGTHYAIEVDEAQNVYVIDLVNGAKSQIEGFEWTQNVQRLESPDGKKLFLAGGHENSSEYGYVAILDFEKRIFAEFDRENPNDIREATAYWFDNNTVVICGEVTYDSVSADAYFYSIASAKSESDSTNEDDNTPQAAPPESDITEMPEPEDGDFVKIIDYIPEIRQELAYATENNFTGCRIYDFTDAYLRYGTVKKLIRVSEELAAQGIGLKIWDGFRPVSAQARLWEICPDPTYVSHPVTGSRSHCRGNTVDITLVDLTTGEELAVPTGFDNFTAKADRDYSDCSDEAAANALLLEETMEKYGFRGYSAEWWHFTDTEEYPIDKQFDPSLPDMWTANCEKYVNLRESAGGDSAVITRIPSGAAMKLQSWHGKYAKVSYNGQTGYVMASYIMPQDETYFSDSLDTVKLTSRYTYEQMREDIATLEADYPDSISVSSIGKSELGRDIPVVRIGDTEAEYHVLLQGAMHGREHMTAWLLMAMADYWLDHGLLGYGDACWHIIPMTNPDGVVISQTGRLTDEQRLIYQSDVQLGYTTLSEGEYARLWKANGLGVDINRNFPAGWESIDDRSLPSSQQYQGEAPFSSAEAAALRDYTLNYDFDATISYHSTGSLIYYEYGNKKSVNNKSRSLAEAVQGISGYTLESSNSVDGAGYKDWVIDELGIPSLTIEIGCEQSALAEREIYSIFARNYRLPAETARWLVS